MPDPSVSLDIQIDLAAWQRVPGLRGRLREAARAVAGHVPKHLRFPFSCTVLLTGNRRVRALNRDFRGIDKPTNVLSFPQYTPRELAAQRKHTGSIELGDIAIAHQYVVAEAKKENKLLIDHLTHLVIHGLLHNFGYDHILDDEAETMEQLEIRIMQAMGLPDPYATALPPTRKKHTR